MNVGALGGEIRFTSEVVRINPRFETQTLSQSCSDRTLWHRHICRCICQLCDFESCPYTFSTCQTHAWAHVVGPPRVTTRQARMHASQLIVLRCLTHRHFHPLFRFGAQADFQNTHTTSSCCSSASAATSTCVFEANTNTHHGWGWEINGRHGVQRLLACKNWSGLH